MKQATLKIECDFCNRIWEHEWEVSKDSHTPEPTLRIINKDACRSCLHELIELGKDIKPYKPKEIKGKQGFYKEPEPKYFNKT